MLVKPVRVAPRSLTSRMTCVWARQGDDGDPSSNFVVLAPDTSNAFRRYLTEVVAAVSSE